MGKYHYTYKVIHKKSGKSYIGVRSSKLKPTEDLGIFYYTSSTDSDFKNDFKYNTHLYETVILNVFKDRILARKDEVHLHERFDVAANPMFYNKAKATLSGFDVEGTTLTEEHKLKISKSSKGHKKSKQTRLRMSKAQRGRVITDEHKKKLSEATENRPRGENHHMYGKTHSSEARIKIGNSSRGRKHTKESKSKISKAVSGKNNGNYGREFTIEHREKISKSRIGMPPGNKGKLEDRVTCPYCNKTGGKNAMQRWHFDRCKFKDK